MTDKEEALNLAHRIEIIKDGIKNGTINKEDSMNEIKEAFSFVHKLYTEGRVSEEEYKFIKAFIPQEVIKGIYN